MNDEYYNIDAFSFFTVQSNIFCLIIMCILLVKYYLKKDILSRSLIYLKGMALSAIICTFFVYHFATAVVKTPVLPSGMFSLSFTSLLSHYIVPFMFIFDWILFQPKGYFKWWHVGGWLVFPLTYFISFLTRCHCNPASAFKNVKKYPYFFLDYETIGVADFCGYIGLLLIIIILENTLIVVLDKFMWVKKKRK